MPLELIDSVTLKLIEDGLTLRDNKENKLLEIVLLDCDGVVVEDIAFPTLEGASEVNALKNIA